MRPARRWADKVYHGDPVAPGLTNSRSHIHPLASPKLHQAAPSRRLGYPFGGPAPPLLTWLRLNPSPILESPMLENLSPEMQPMGTDLPIPGPLPVPI